METDHSTDIAIIGLSCRFPGAEGVRDYWRLLCAGQDVITHFGIEESEADEALARDSRFVPSAGVLTNAHAFDPEFFGITRAQSVHMPPASRLMLECAWESIEDAGYQPASLPESTAVYAAGDADSISRYSGPPDLALELDEYMNRYGAWAPDGIAASLLYNLGLSGEAVTVAAMCAGFHYAVHFACQSLLLGQADVAIVAAGQVRQPQLSGHIYQPGKILSKDGVCRPFDADGTGTVLSSGVAAAVLKPVDEAVRDGDHVYAVVKGTAVNNNGIKAPAYGVTQPDRVAACVATALAAADSPPDTISFIETFGVGLPIADALEISALQRVFGPRSENCHIGSVKGNLGHCGAASGGAAALKTALALHHRQIPGTAHHSEPHADIGIDATPFNVLTECSDWDPVGGVRRAGVTVLGGGGHNAHLILEEHTGVSASAPEHPPTVVPVSARTPESLLAMRKALYDAVRANTHIAWHDVCYTLQVGRRAEAHRWAVMVSNREELLAALSEDVADAISDNRPPSAMSVHDTTVGLGPSNDMEVGDPLAQGRLARRWVAGTPIDWEAWHRGHQHRRVSLPPSRFERSQLNSALMGAG